MGDAINFGPAWLRKVATFDSNAVSSIGGPPHSTNNNNNTSSSSSSSTSNNQTISNNNNNNSNSSGSAGGGGGGGSTSAALAAANAAAAAAAAVAAAAAASTTTRYALAEFRYGREEMLALFDVKAVKTPEILVSFKNLFVDKVQCPLALTPCTDDDVVPEPDTRRTWQTRSISLGVPGRGARGGSVDRGRGRGRGVYLGYQRSTSFYDDESRSVGRGERPWLERNGTGGPLGGSGGTGGGEVDWNSSGSSPRKEFGVRARTANMESWRRARPDDEPTGATTATTTDWRSGSCLNTSGGSGGGGGGGSVLSGSGLRDKWSRSTSWREEDGGTNDGSGSGLGRPGLGGLHSSSSSERMIPTSGVYKPRMSVLSGAGGTGDMSGGSGGGTGPMSALRRNWDTEDQLPEWATENPSDYGGSFDASGAFHDSDNDVDGRQDDEGGKHNHVDRKGGSSTASSRRSASSKEGSATKEVLPNHLLEKQEPSVDDSQKGGKRDEQKLLDQKEETESSKSKEDSVSAKGLSSSRESISSHPSSVDAPKTTTHETAAESEIQKPAANSSSITVDTSTKPPSESPSRGRETVQSRDMPKKSASSSSVDRMQEVADDMVAQLIMDDEYTGAGEVDPTPTASRSLDKSPVLGAQIPINLLLSSKEPVAMQQLFGSSSAGSGGSRNLLLSDVNRSMLHGVGPQMPPIHHPGTDIWYYRDPQGKVQGPFPASEMTEWYRAGYFDDSLSVRRACDEIYTTLGTLVALCGGAIPFLNSMNIPPIKSSSINAKPQQQQQQQPQPPQAPTSSFQQQQQKPASTLQQHLQQHQQQQQQQGPSLDSDLSVQLQFSKKIHQLRQHSLLLQKLSATDGWNLLSQEQQNAIVAQHMAQLQLGESMLISPSLPTPTSSSNPPNPASIFGGVVPSPQDSLVNLKQAAAQHQQQQQQAQQQQQQSQQAGQQHAVLEQLQKSTSLSNAFQKMQLPDFGQPQPGRPMLGNLNVDPTAGHDHLGQLIHNINFNHQPPVQNLPLGTNMLLKHNLIGSLTPQQQQQQQQQQQPQPSQQPQVPKPNLESDPIQSLLMQLSMHKQQQQQPQQPSKTPVELMSPWLQTQSMSQQQPLQPGLRPLSSGWGDLPPTSSSFGSLLQQQPASSQPQPQHLGGHPLVNVSSAANEPQAPSVVSLFKHHQQSEKQNQEKLVPESHQQQQQQHLQHQQQQQLQHQQQLQQHQQQQQSQHHNHQQQQPQQGNHQQQQQLFERTHQKQQQQQIDNAVVSQQQQQQQQQQQFAQKPSKEDRKEQEHLAQQQLQQQQQQMQQRHFQQSAKQEKQSKQNQQKAVNNVDVEEQQAQQQQQQQQQQAGKFPQQKNNKKQQQSNQQHKQQHPDDDQGEFINVKKEMEEKKRQKELKKQQQEELKRKQLEEKKKQEEMDAQKKAKLLEVQRREASKIQEQQQPRPVTKIAPWSASVAETVNSGPSLDEIQKAERERRAALARQEQSLREQQQQQEIIELQSQLDSKLKWNAQNLGPQNVKSLAEIQAEEAAAAERTREKNQAALTAASIAATAAAKASKKEELLGTAVWQSQSGVLTWNTAKLWANSGDEPGNVSSAGGFWEEPTNHSNNNKNGRHKQQNHQQSAQQQQQAQNQKQLLSKSKTMGSISTSSSSNAVAAAKQQQQKNQQMQQQQQQNKNAAKGSSGGKNSGGASGAGGERKERGHGGGELTNEFTSWCSRALTSLNSNVDIPTFVGFLQDIESPFEVKDYIRLYLGETKECAEFAKQFLERRSKYKNQMRQKNAHIDDMCKPAPAINPSSNDFMEIKGKNKKVKKNKMTKLDNRCLGFSVTAAPDRLNVGDRDYGDNA